MTQTANRPTETEDLRALLMREHTRLHAVFADVAAAFASGNEEAAAQLFTVLEGNLEEHFRLEEEHVLPGLARVDAQEAQALRAEHDVFRSKLTELGIGVDLHATRSEAIDELVRLLDAHAAREDALAYRQAETTLPEPVRAQLRGQVRGRLEKLVKRVRALRPT